MMATEYERPEGEVEKDVWGIWEYRFDVVYQKNQWYWRVVNLAGVVEAKSVRGFNSCKEAVEAARATQPRMPLYFRDEQGVMRGGHLPGTQGVEK